MKDIFKFIIFCFGIFIYGIGIRYYDLFEQGWKGMFVVICGVLILYLSFVLSSSLLGTREKSK